MARVLVTGASGFIGSNLCRYFLSQGDTVFALVRPSSSRAYLDGLAVQPIVGDLTRPETLSLPENLDFVVHSASIVSDLADDATCRQNILGLAQNLVAALKKSNPTLRKLVYLSTALTLGYGKLDISENNPGIQADFLPYTRYKKATETYLRQACHAAAWPLIILRPADVYGPYDRTSCLHMLRACSQGLPLIVGHGRWQFGFCYVDNLARATRLACLAQVNSGNAYTVTNGRPITWREFFAGLQGGVGKRQRLYVPVTLAYTVAALQKFGHLLWPRFTPTVNFYRVRRITSHTTYDISTTIHDLGYTPDTDHAAQIQAIVDWFKAHAGSCQ